MCLNKKRRKDELPCPLLGYFNFSFSIEGNFIEKILGTESTVLLTPRVWATDTPSSKFDKNRKIRGTDSNNTEEIFEVLQKQRNPKRQAEIEKFRKLRKNQAQVRQVLFEHIHIFCLNIDANWRKGKK